jgi:hypothetical protein
MGYQDNPLQEREIRLVKILKATTSIIACEVHRAWWLPSSEYAAPSYAWVDVNATR